MGSVREGDGSDPNLGGQLEFFVALAACYCVCVGGRRPNACCPPDYNKGGGRGGILSRVKGDEVGTHRGTFTNRTSGYIWKII